MGSISFFGKILAQIFAEINAVQKYRKYLQYFVAVIIALRKYYRIKIQILLAPYSFSVVVENQKLLRCVLWGYTTHILPKQASRLQG